MTMKVFQLKARALSPPLFNHKFNIKVWLLLRWLLVLINNYRKKLIICLGFKVLSKIIKLQTTLFFNLKNDFNIYSSTYILFNDIKLYILFVL